MPTRGNARQMPAGISLSRLLTLAAPLLLALSGCTSYGVIQNTPLPAGGPVQPYSLKAASERRDAGEVLMILAFSGGGTRAAAASYGVLQELRDTTVDDRRLLDEVDRISSVSGGSFTAAYYGLNGDGIFEDFETVFLKRNVQDSLISLLFNPFNWFSSEGRTDRAVEYYNQEVFHNATFADMMVGNRPLVVINTSDLAYGVRFSFLQEYFNLLCSDLSTFPVSRAVTASSAVPVLFQPIVVENYDECGDQKPAWLIAAEKQAVGRPELAMLVEGIDTYFDKRHRKYAHFVDGGITDNLGLRAIYEMIELAGGVTAAVQKNRGGKLPRRVVVISVDASTRPPPTMDQSNEQPGLEETINAMSDVQLHRYNVETIALMERSLQQWKEELSTPAQPVEPYFIRLDLEQVVDADEREFLNAIPTSFDLSDEQVDRVVAASRELLHDNAEFQRLVNDLGGRISSAAN